MFRLLEHFRTHSCALGCLVLTWFAHATHAEVNAIPPGAAVIENYQDISILIEQVSVVTPASDVDFVFGVTGNFRMGRQIFAEVRLSKKVSYARMMEAARENGTTLQFRCERVIVYLLSGVRIARGKGCRMALCLE